jgi:hypothetical protein
VNDSDVSSLIDREDLIDLLGSGVPHENFDYRGMSGGPMLTAVEHHGLRSWRLAGVIYARIPRMAWCLASPVHHFRLSGQDLTLDQVAKFRRTRRVKEDIRRFASVSAAFERVGRIQMRNPGLHVLVHVARGLEDDLLRPELARERL